MGIFRFFCLPYFSPYSFLGPLFTFVPFYFHCLFLAKFRPSGHWCWSFSCVPNSFFIYVDISHFPLFGSWHFLIWPLFSPLSLPLLVSSVSFLVHLFYNPLQFLYLIFLTFVIPTQGTFFVKLLEVISVTYLLDFPPCLRYAKVHSGGGACQKSRGREIGVKRLT